MGAENCKLCNQESIPWVRVHGHVCETCFCNAKWLYRKDKPAWISVKEHLPDETQGVLVWAHGYSSDYIEIAVYQNNRFTVDNVSHWMPLPEKPTENKLKNCSICNIKPILKEYVEEDNIRAFYMQCSECNNEGPFKHVGEHGYQKSMELCIEEWNNMQNS